MFVFVYGSLKKGFKYHYLIENNSVFIGEAKTKDKYSMSEYKDHGYPFLSKKECSQIYGELYEIECIDDLDKLEGVPTHYYRDQMEIICSDIKYKAEAYFLVEDIEIDNNINKWTLEMENKSY